MNKFLSILFSILFYSSFCVAQNWSTKTYIADELLETTGGVTYLYTDEYGNTFEYGSLNGNKYFRSDITMASGIFNYSTFSAFGVSVNQTFGVVGLYDNTGKLIKKWKEKFIIPENSSNNICRPTKYKDIENFLNNQQGYVIFVISKFQDNDFRMKVPCRKN